MKSYIVRDVAKEIGVSVNTFRYHLGDLKEGVDYTRGDNNNRATITEDALYRIANNGKFKFSSILLRFLELNKACGLDVPSAESSELESCKKDLEYLQQSYNELNADCNKMLQDKLELQGFKDRYSKEYANMEKLLEAKDDTVQTWIGAYNEMKEKYIQLENLFTKLSESSEELCEKNDELLYMVYDGEVKTLKEAFNKNSKEFDIRTKVLLIWNILTSVLLALSFLK